MTYTPNTWATGDTITAAKLNNMEQGIVNASGGGLVLVESSYDIETGHTTCDHTAQQVITLMAGGSSVAIGYATPEDEEYQVAPIMCAVYSNYDPSDFYFAVYTVNSGGNIISWTADTSSGYVYTTLNT